MCHRFETQSTQIIVAITRGVLNQVLAVVMKQVQVEDFKDAELMLDITEHTLVPEHMVGWRWRCFRLICVFEQHLN